ncbi:helix-turn-helix domain-containing protein [Chromobacterium amazonense]|uniref:helix-turn-helix domain-containing protein n=1 Tax=Chromobacterium amazonense TaxID=1382803 RepID=UPI003F790E30
MPLSYQAAGRADLCNNAMEYLKAASHEEICGYLASKIRRERTQRKESQEAFAKRAGVALRTFKRLEIDGRGHLDTFVKVLKALDKVICPR